MSNRIPLAEAIEEPLLFHDAFYGTGKKDDQGFSIPQRAIIKAIYGLPLDDKELLTWAALNGQGVYDDLGYLVDVRAPFAYTPGTEFEDITLILGRRWAKTSLSSFILGYEAICGGHWEHLGRSKHQVPIFLQVAQDLATARANLRQHILSVLESSPIGRKEIGDVKTNVTAEEIRLAKGRIIVAAPSIKARGQSVAVAALDECGFWPSDAEAAAQDVEIERAIIPAMAQFPFRKRLKTSTPLTKQGILWMARDLGTYGHRVGSPESRRKVMVLQGPTATAENPTVTRAFLQTERDKDPEAFNREFLAQFADSITGFLSRTLLDAAVPRGLRQRPAKPDTLYVATMDPAFRRDTFALSIGHIEDGKFILDLLEGWRGTRDVPISPAVVMTYIAGRLKEYGIRSIVSDQYHMESLQELAEQQDFALEPFPLTNQVKKQMWGEFALMLAQGKLALLDHPDFIDECAKLEKTLTASGATQISGTRDDYAMCVALNLHRALQFGERRPPQAVVKPTTHEEQFWAALRAKKPSEQPWYV